MAEPMRAEDVQKALRELPGWAFEDDKLQKTFELNSFPEAVSFILRLAFHAEALNHHPELRNVYNKVEVALTTHDAGDKVTQKDVKLARAIEAFSWV